MTEDRATLAELALNDLKAGLGSAGVTCESFTPEDLTDDIGVVVWSCTAAQAKEFLRVQVPAGGKTLTLQGVTLIRTAADGSKEFRRFIDWLDVIHQLGLTAGVRPVADLP